MMDVFGSFFAVPSSNLRRFWVFWVYVGLSEVLEKVMLRLFMDASNADLKVLLVRLKLMLESEVINMEMNCPTETVQISFLP